MKASLVLLTLLFAIEAAALDIQPGLGFTGSHGSAGSGSQSQRLRGSAVINHEFGEDLRLFASTLIETDAEDALEPGRPDAANRSALNRRLLLGSQTSLELREAWFAVSAGDWAGEWDWRLGKQQIVWGQSDGIKMLDVVNPQSLREFIVDDFDRSRIPLWTLRATRSVGERGELELIAIPDLTFHDLPESGALFAPTSPQLAPQGAALPDTLSLLSARLLSGLAEPLADPLANLLGPLIGQIGSTVDPLLPQRLRDRLAPRIFETTERPKLSAESVELGARLRTTLGAVDIALIALRHYNDVPTVKIAISQGVERIDATRYYVQTHTLGVQTAWPIGAWLLRGEFLHSQRAPLPALDLPDDGLDATAPLISGLVGLDRSVRAMGLVSVQLAETRLQTTAHDYRVPHRQRYVTALWRDEILPGRLGAELFGILETGAGDSLLRARLSWMLRDSLEARFGLDIFSGSRDGVFGQYDGLDRLSLEFNWSL